jgi:archaellum component FlaC
MTKTQIMLDSLEEKINLQSESINELCKTCKSLVSTQKNISKRINSLEKKIENMQAEISSHSDNTQTELSDIKQCFEKISDDINNISEASRLLLITSVLNEADEH